MMKMNSPKLKTVIGRVRNISSGLSTALSSPSSIAVTINDIGLSILIPGRIFTTTKMAAAVISVLSKNLFKQGPFAIIKSLQ